MEINDILKLIEAVSEHGLTSFVLEENGSKISMKKEKEVITVTAAPAVQTVIAPAAADARDISGTAPSVPAGYMAPAVSATGTEMSRSESIGSDKVVTSPLVGTFYNAASPDSDAFVSVGDTVKKGQVLGIIEAMKLMNVIESEYDGVVEAVLVNNEEVVEYGQPLIGGQTIAGKKVEYVRNQGNSGDYSAPPSVPSHRLHRGGNARRGSGWI